MSTSNLRIGIVGGGPGGLTLGNILHKRNIPFTIFDLRSRITHEELDQPAGPLDLHEDTGLAALKELALLEDFKALTGDCSEAQRVADKHGNILHEDQGENSERPEISRHKLIRLLLANLPPSTILWNYKLVHASRLDSGEIELDFGDKGKRVFDLVVGADGAWSRVRPLLTEVRPQYAGFQLFTLNIRNLNTSYPHLAEYVGTGNFSALGDKHMVASQRSVHESARIWIFLYTEDEQFPTTQGLLDKSPADVRDFVLGDIMPFQHWGKQIKELISVACEDEAKHNHGRPIDIKPLYRLPVGHTWEHQTGVTLLGDAAHVMNPGAGDGVNLAMKEALLLANAITDAQSQTTSPADLPQKLDAHLRTFEEAMWAEAKESQDGTLEINDMMFGHNDGAQRMADFFQSFR